MGNIPLKAHKKVWVADSQREKAEKNKEWEERAGNDMNKTYWGGCRSAQAKNLKWVSRPHNALLSFPLPLQVIVSASASMDAPGTSLLPLLDL